MVYTYHCLIIIPRNQIKNGTFSDPEITKYTKLYEARRLQLKERGKNPSYTPLPFSDTFPKYDKTWSSVSNSSFRPLVPS